MSKRTVSGIALTLLFIGMLTLAFNIQPVKASRTIYIRADGSVDPSDAPISSVDNVTYTITNNINDSIVVERNNIVIDGADYTLQGTSAKYSKGISLSGRSNITIRNMKVEVFWYGIWLETSSNNSISENKITNNEDGIRLESSSNNTISENNIADDKRGIRLQSSSYNTICRNNVTNTYDGVTFASSYFNNLYRNNITNNRVGIWLYYYPSYNTINGNNITNNGYGILSTDFSNNNSISRNNITNNEAGIFLERSSNNSVSGNNITNNNHYGISLWESSNNTLDGNNITYNGHGTRLYLSSYNTIYGNVMSGNEYSFWVRGDELSHFMHSIDASNLVNGKPVYYLINQTNLVIDSAIYPQVGYLALINCANITVEGLTLINNGQGLLFAYTSDSKVTRNDVTSNHVGIDLISSNYNIIFQNNITENGQRHVFGDGICLAMDSSRNIIFGNNVLNNYHGISLWESSDNSIYHNYFINNTHQVYVNSGYENIWDDGYPSGGNYWSDYTVVDSLSGPYQNETGGDGIGDTPYIIDVNNQDNYPLMEPWSPPPSIAGDLNSDGIVDISDIATAGKAFGSYPGHPRWDSTADMNNDDIVNILDIALIARNFGKTA